MVRQLSAPFGDRLGVRLLLERRTLEDIMRAFLSHISEEAPEARALKESLEAAVVGAEVFVSAVNIHLGDAWLREIDEALAGAKVVLALCSPNSVQRPWLNFESGSGWSRR